MLRWARGSVCWGVGSAGFIIRSREPGPGRQELQKLAWTQRLVPRRTAGCPSLGFEELRPSQTPFGQRGSWKLPSRWVARSRGYQAGDDLMRRLWAWGTLVVSGPWG